MRKDETWSSIALFFIAPILDQLISLCGLPGPGYGGDLGDLDEIMENIVSSFSRLLLENTRRDGT